MVLTFSIRDQRPMAAAVLSSAIASGLINARAGIDYILQFHTDQLQPEFLSVCSLYTYLSLPFVTTHTCLTQILDKISLSFTTVLYYTRAPICLINYI